MTLITAKTVNLYSAEQFNDTLFFWTQAQTDISFTVPEGYRLIELQTDCSTDIYAHLGNKPFKIAFYINAIKCLEETVNESKRSVFAIKNLSNKTDITFTIQTDATYNPSSHGNSCDSRNLGLILFSLKAVAENMQREQKVFDIDIGQRFLIRNFEQLNKFVTNFTNSNCEGMNPNDYLRAHMLCSRSFFKLFKSEPSQADPFSEEYYNWEMDFFKFLSGKEYNTSNEGVNYLAINKPAAPGQNNPSTTAASATPDKKISDKATIEEINTLKVHQYISEQLLHYQNPKVLEMGCGLGNMAAFLEPCCDYHAIDVCPDFIELTKRRLNTEKSKKQLKNCSFEEVDFGVLLDIIIFEASFHHATKPVDTLNRLHKITSRDAQILFIKEPVENVSDRPWGLTRYDGEAIYQIRYRGWMELGFRTDFFTELLNRTGWKISERLDIVQNVSIFKAVKKT